MDRHTPSAESIPRVHSLRKTKLFFFFFRHRWRHKHFSPVAERNKMCGKKRRMNRTKNQSFMFHTAFSVRHRFQKRQAANPADTAFRFFESDLRKNDFFPQEPSVSSLLFHQRWKRKIPFRTERGNIRCQGFTDRFFR